MMSKKLITVLGFIIVISCPVKTITPLESLVRRQSRLIIANNTDSYSFVVLGASGDLAKRMIYPALWNLYLRNQLPLNTQIYGFARSDLQISGLRKKVDPFIKLEPEENQMYEQFWSKNHFVRNYPNEYQGYDRLCNTLKKAENMTENGNRIFYLSLPPEVFENSTNHLKRACISDKGWTRVVVEKPFGRDSMSSERLSKHLLNIFTEDQIYRMDHYLGKEMVQNLLTLRFANRMLSPAWNRDNIASIKIDFRENFGIENRSDFFDSNGIIRDVMQNHMIQIMSLIAMEQPKSLKSIDVRNEKVKLLKSTRTIEFRDVVLGQYEGYLSEPGIPKNSLQSTFATIVLKVNNMRWRNVPFILRAGKGLDEKSTKVYIQFKNVDNDISNGKSKRNELIIRIGVDEFIKAEIMSKKPGFSTSIENIGLDFKYADKYKGLVFPSAYEKLILDVFHGYEVNFVRTDELSEAWRIFTPLLHKIDNRKIPPIKYKFGTTGPTAADDLEKKYNFLK